jgi:hypothetical protein
MYGNLEKKSDKAEMRICEHNEPLFDHRLKKLALVKA